MTTDNNNDIIHFVEAELVPETEDHPIRDTVPMAEAEPYVIADITHTVRPRGQIPFKLLDCIKKLSEPHDIFGNEKIRAVIKFFEQGIKEDKNTSYQYCLETAVDKVFGNTPYSSEYQAFINNPHIKELNNMIMTQDAKDGIYVKRFEP